MLFQLPVAEGFVNCPRHNRPQDVEGCYTCPSMTEIDHGTATQVVRCRTGLSTLPSVAPPSLRWISAAPGMTSLTVRER